MVTRFMRFERMEADKKVPLEWEGNQNDKNDDRPDHGLKA